MNSANRPRMVDGHVVRDGGSVGASSFSFRRFLLLAVLGTLLVVTNPANEMQDTAANYVGNVVDYVMGNTEGSRQRDLSDWAWQKVLDPPLSVTNYGIFTIEDRNTKVVFTALGTQSWSCSYYDESMGNICNALGKYMVL